MHRLRVRGKQQGPSTPRFRLAIPTFVVALLTLAFALPAVASAAPFPLTIEFDGTGTGEVECEVEAGPAEPCEAEYEAGTELALVPVAEEGSEFVEFYGDCGPLACELTMDEEHVVTATFDAEEPEFLALAVEAEGTGSGTVECEVEAGPAEPCEAEYEEGTELALLAEPDLGSEFVEWSGDCSGTGPCELTMDEEHSVGAIFEPEPQEFALNIEEPGAGEGTVECEAEEGPEPCKAEYPEGTELIVLATADLGSEFVEFGGDCGPAECELTMDEEHTVSVLFELEGGESPTVTEVTPNKGTTAGGTAVTIKGTNLTGATEVKYGATAVTCTGVVATCKVESATEIKATTPAHAAGEIDVRVVTPGGESVTGAGDKFKFETPASPPTVTEVTPNKGTTAGGTAVTIKGTNLTGATEVKYGATAVTCTGVVATCKVESATEIKATTPAHAAGEIDVRVVTPGGESVTGAGDKFKFETPASPPTVTEVTPNKGTTAGGTAVTIKGTNLTGATEVKYGATAVTCTGVVATCKVESATEIKATTPAHAAGEIDVRVVTPGGESVTGAGDKFKFETPASPPTVTEVTPNKGTTAGGTAVTIKGTNLTGATEVKYGATAVTCTGVVATCKVESATEIKATTPAHAAGEIDVRVVTPGGESVTGAGDKFKFETPASPPTVTEVTPNKGTTAGGTAVTIKGTNLTGATEVKYGATAVTCTGVVATCKVESATEIKATTPAHAAGEIDVRVVTPGGESVTGAGDKFKFETPASPPTVTEVTPNKGTTAGGTAVTIKGTNLTGATEVKYGATAVTCTGVVATCKVESATEIKATTPAHAAGEIDVRVVTPGGESVTGAGDKFKFETPASPPTVTEVTPNKGTTAGGTAVTIKGTNLTGATEVKYGATAVTCTGVVATCKVESATEIKATTPAHAAGEIDVRVVTPGGESVTGAGDKFKFETPASPPTVTEVTPNKGTTAGGTAVTIKGTNLTGATEVKYGATAVTCTGVVATCKVESATEIKATTPAHAAGEIDVRVVTPGGESVTGAGDKFTFETQSGGGGGGGSGGSGGGGGGGGGTPTTGTAKAASTASYSGGKAALKLTCSGGACSGSLKLTAKVKQGKKTKNLVIGKASFSLASGATTTLKVKLSGPAKQELAKGKTLKAKLSGTGISASTVKIKPPKKKKK